MSLDLPTPINQALLNERIQTWAEALVASYQAWYPDAPVRHIKGDEVPVPAPYVISVDVLRRYWRIVLTQYGSRSVHAFVDPATGDVYKAAGWKAPAKGVRFNLLNDESFTAMIELVDPFGGYLYVR